MSNRRLFKDTRGCVCSLSTLVCEWNLLCLSPHRRRTMYGLAAHSHKRMPQLKREENCCWLCKTPSSCNECVGWWKTDGKHENEKTSSAHHRHRVLRRLRWVNNEWGAKRYAMRERPNVRAPTRFSCSTRISSCSVDVDDCSTLFPQIGGHVSNFDGIFPVCIDIWWISAALSLSFSYRSIFQLIRKKWCKFLLKVLDSLLFHWNHSHFRSYATFLLFLSQSQKSSEASSVHRPAYTLAQSTRELAEPIDSHTMKS